MKKPFVPLLFFPLLLTTAAPAQKTSFFRKLNPDSLSSGNLRFLPLPTVSVSPETGLQVGVLLDYFYRTRSTDSSRKVRPSNSWVSVLYSTRGQFNAEASTSTFTTDEKWYLQLRGGFRSAYERFWGFTQTTANADYQETRYDRLFAQGRAARNLGGQVFAGPAFLYSRHADTRFEAKGDGPPSVPANNNNSRIAGGGLGLTLDRRDNPFSPTRGVYADVQTLLNWNLATGRYAYTTTNLDLRTYREWDRSVVAVQTLFWLANHDMPLLEKWRLGGGTAMRGLFQGRYRDNNLWTAQAEYRYGLHRLVKLALFTGVGNTAPTTGRLFAQPLQATYGAGVRLLANKDKKVYFRIDAAWGSNGQFGYYFRVGDAF